MLAGSGLVVAGIWVRVVADRPCATVRHETINGPLVAALALIALGLTINALNIGFMAGAGTHMAEQFAAGRTDVAPLFEATHPIGLIAARFGNFIVALGAVGARLGGVAGHLASAMARVARVGRRGGRTRWGVVLQ